MNVKIDTTVTSTRPDIKVKIQSPGLPGSFVVKGKDVVPNLKDKATAAREEVKKIKPVANNAEPPEEKNIKSEL